MAKTIRNCAPALALAALLTGLSAAPLPAAGSAKTPRAAAGTEEDWEAPQIVNETW
jgi:hypothetical protein